MRALWSWEWSVSMLQNYRIVLDFCKKFGFNQIYVQLYPIHLTGTYNSQLVRAMVADFQANNIGIWGIVNQGGVSATNPPDPAKDKPLVDAYKNFGLFDGLVFDIENLKGCAQLIHPYLDALSLDGVRKAIYIDPPVYLGAGARELYQRFDIILLNTYRPTAQGIIDTAKTGADLCYEINKHFMCGLEALPSYENSFDGTLKTYRSMVQAIDTAFPSPLYQGTYLDSFQYVKEWSETMTIEELQAALKEAAAMLAEQDAKLKQAEANAAQAITKLQLAESKIQRALLALQ